MTVSLRATLRHELKSVIDRHLKELDQYITLPEFKNNQASDNILMTLERLDAICSYPVHAAPCELYQEALECQDTIKAFLHRMNQDIDAEFEETHIGQIWSHASTWCKTVGQQFQRTPAQVWELLAPVQPDHLDVLGNGLYEARWWKPVPMMDIELLYYTEGIIPCGPPYEPAQLPNGLAVQFSVTTDR